VRATKVILATGDALVVEAGEHRCWHADEVSDFPVQVDDGTVCDICEEVIGFVDYPYVGGQP